MPMKGSHMPTVDETRTDDVKRRIAAASPEPWLVSRDEQGDRMITTGRSDRGRLYIKRDLAAASDEDFAFIALARSALPRLLEAVTTGDFNALTTDELSEIEAVLARTSAGPWTAFLEETQPIGGCSMIWVGDEADAPDMYVWLEDNIAPAGDIEFIAAAREDLPDLLSEIRYLRGKGR
ncbi:MAG: hypothetical protein ACRDTG_01090 [Pseudonocardiaceae bacterium]